MDEIIPGQESPENCEQCVSADDKHGSSEELSSADEAQEAPEEGAEEASPEEAAS